MKPKVSKKRHRLPKKLKEAFRAYYRNRKDCKNQGKKWDKTADLKRIFEALPKSCVYAEASAGTFWLTWKRPAIQTTHSEANWWTMKILTRKVKATWVPVKSASFWA